MAVAVHNRAAIEPWKRASVLHEELAEDERLLREPLRALIVRKEFAQLVTKDRRTTRLEADDRRAGVDVGGERVDHMSQPALRRREHSVVEEGPAAAERRQRHLDVEP